MRRVTVGYEFPSLTRLTRPRCHRQIIPLADTTLTLHEFLLRHSRATTITTHGVYSSSHRRTRSRRHQQGDSQLAMYLAQRNRQFAPLLAVPTIAAAAPLLAEPHHALPIASAGAATEAVTSFDVGAAAASAVLSASVSSGSSASHALSSSSASPPPLPRPVTLPFVTRTTRLRPYPCRVCGMMLSSASNRLRHERSKHPESAPHKGKAIGPVPNTTATTTDPVTPRAAASTAGGADEPIEELQRSKGDDERASAAQASTAQGERPWKVRVVEAVAAAYPAAGADAGRGSRRAFPLAVDGSPLIAKPAAGTAVVKTNIGPEQKESQSNAASFTVAQAARPAAAPFAAATPMEIGDEAEDALLFAQDEDGEGEERLPAAPAAAPDLRASSSAAAASKFVESAHYSHRSWLDEGDSPEGCSPEPKKREEHDYHYSSDEEGRTHASSPMSAARSGAATAAAAAASHEVPSSSPSSSSSSRSSSSGAASGESAAWMEGHNAIVNEELLQRACYPFLQWLTQPPMTSVEALVKGRRVNSLTQLTPIKLNLRFIFALLVQRGILSDILLPSVSRLAVCQALHEALISRKVGSARIHALFLLIKKILVFLSSEESTRNQKFIQPSSSESFFFVDSVCSESSQKRKQEARNRAVLGINVSQQLKQQEDPAHQRQASFQIPISWSSSSSSSDGSNLPHRSSKKSSTAPATLAPTAAATGAAAAAATAPSLGDQTNCNELSSEELKVVAQGCLVFLNESVRENQSASDAQRQRDLRFMVYLVTATLCLGLAPRSQVLQQLRIGSTFVREADGRYWVKMPAEMNKNSRPTLFALAAQVTLPFDFYLNTVRPRLLLGASHDFVFMKKNGEAPRRDFSELTSVATQQLIGHPVNAHAFRSAVITSFYNSGASQSDMDSLANIMAHDASTARNYYYRPKAAQAAVGTSDRMLDVLQLGSAAISPLQVQASPS